MNRLGNYQADKGGNSIKGETKKVGSTGATRLYLRSRSKIIVHGFREPRTETLSWYL